MYGLQAQDFSLPRFLVSPDVAGRIQGGLARLMILPFRPQPALNPEMLEHFGLAPVSDDDLLAGVRLAHSMGLIQPPIAPIRLGHAFELHSAFVPERCHKIGTGIVQRMGVARLQGITPRHWRRCGYSTREAFMHYWEQATADLAGQPNPWCWLIQFTFKG